MSISFCSERVSQHITRIFGFCSELMYLIEGSHEAILIDTGCGVGSLATYVHTLTEKPIRVLLSHGYLDHAMGSTEFEKVHLSPLDMEVYHIHSDLDYRLSFQKGFGKNEQVSSLPLLPPMSVERIQPLYDGDSFDLGDITVKAIACAGHSPGSFAFLIPEERTIMLGDACNSFTFLFEDTCSSVREYRISLGEFHQKTKGTYDTVLLSHDQGIGVADVVEQVIAVCDDVLEGKITGTEYNFLNSKGRIAMPVDENGKRLDGKFGNIVFNPQKID